MNKKIKSLLVLLSLLFAIGLQAQEKSAIGIKVGRGAEIIYQRFFSEKERMELSISTYRYSFTGVLIGANYQWVNNISDTDTAFKWYYGVGAKVGALYRGTPAFTTIIQGQIGIEYKIPNSPIKLSLDYCPAASVIPKFKPLYTGGGLTVRYKF